MVPADLVSVLRLVGAAGQGTIRLGGGARTGASWEAEPSGVANPKHADCRSAADRGVDADRGVALAKDDVRELTRRGPAHPQTDRQLAGSVACLSGSADRDATSCAFDDPAARAPSAVVA